MEKKNVRINPTYEEIKDQNILECEKHLPERYWEYRRKWEINPKYNIVEDFPLNLDLEVTSYCNLRCPMCYRTIVKMDKTKKEKLGFMSWQLFQKCIDEGAQYGLYAIKLNYRGEPLLHKDLPKMIAYAKKKGVVDVQFNTNGVLLKGDLAREILEAGVNKVIISFDSIRKEKYEKIRVGAVFEEVVKNVEDFIHLRDSLGLKSSVCVRVSMVKMKDNLDEVDEFYNFWKQRGADIISYVNYVNYLGLDPQAENRYPKKPNAMKDDFICAQLWQRLFVLWNGTVTPCCGDLEANCKLGDANTDSLYSIWKGTLLNNLRSLHWNGQYKQMQICNKCSLPYTVAALEV